MSLDLQVYTTIRNFKEDLTRYPPNHFVCVPLVLDTLYNRARLFSLRPAPLHQQSAMRHCCKFCPCQRAFNTQVQAQIKKGSKVKKALAGFFLSASTAFVRARRVVDGVALKYARQPRPLLALLWAAMVATFLAPLHRSDALFSVSHRHTGMFSRRKREAV